MADIDIDKIAEIQRKIGALLLHDWDPIGIANVPEAHDEYRDYIRSVYDIVVNTRSAQAIGEHLVRIERKYMGLFVFGWQPWRKRLPVAQKILDLVSEVGPLP